MIEIEPSVFVLIKTPLIQQESIPILAQWDKTHSIGFLALTITQELGLTCDFETITSEKLIESTPNWNKEGNISRIITLRVNPDRRAAVVIN